jgi:signal transduction histidine kinase
VGRSAITDGAKALIILTSYYLAGVLSSKFLLVGGMASPVWPPTGLALAFLLLFGWRFWPVVGLGACLTEISNNGQLPSSFLIGIGNIGEALTGYFLLKRVARLRDSLSSLKQSLAFVLFGGLVSPLVSAAIGVLSLRWTNQIGSSEFYFTAIVWWLANGLGTLLIVPVILAWKNQELSFRITPRFLEAMTITFLLVLMSLAIFGPFFGPIYHRPAAYFIFPFFLLASIRFDQPLSVVGALIVSFVGIWGTAKGYGPFAVGNWVESIFHLQTFLFVLASTGLVFSGIVMERRQEREDLNRHLLIEKSLRESEERFRSFNTYLEKRVADRTTELERTNRELEEFAYITSHDLQEPLRAVTSFGLLLDEEFGNSLPPRAKEYLKYVVGGAQRMQSLIGDLLNYSRLGGDNAKSRSLENMRNLVEEAKSFLIKSVQESGAVITCDELPTLRVEKDRLVQVFQNLIGNAIKFRGDRSPEISVTGILKDSVWEICVADNGIGISPQYKERIFQIFQRLHARSEYPGSGIGLSICKKIIERFNGRIWVESELGRGSKFYFTIPITEEERPLIS